jgi:uncharacterized membrane protein YphA (DoxX/SURF4 family)
MFWSFSTGPTMFISPRCAPPARRATGSYGPAPETFVIVIGVIELAGGLLLIIGVFTRPAALVLAADMLGAIVVSGIAKGELVSLTLAPAELVAMLVLLWTGPAGAALRPSPPVSVLRHKTLELLR